MRQINANQLGRLLRSRISVDVAARSLGINGMIDQLPAFEAYATINDGTGFPLFRLPPPAVNTVMNLPRAANRPVKFKVEDRNGNGVFDTLIRL